MTNLVESRVNKLNLMRPNLSQHCLNANTADISFVCSYRAELGYIQCEKIPAHKIILASVSSVFQAMFYSHLPEKDVIELPDVTADGFKQFLHLFYNTEVKFSVDHVHEVLYLAEKYDIPDYVFMCSKYLIENGHEAFQTETFLCCSQTVLQTILQNKYSKGEGVLLLQACINWAENACNFHKLASDSMENRLKVLGNCLDSIEYASITQSAAIDFMLNYHGIFNVNQIGHMLQSISKRLCAVDFDNDYIKWPSHLNVNAEILQLEKGKTHTMELATQSPFLLHGIGFHIPDNVSNPENITLLFSIEKFNSNSDDSSKVKIFFGRLPMHYRLTDNRTISMCASLPDTIVFDAFSAYSMEMTPFEEVKIQCYDRGSRYENVSHDYEFTDSYIVFLRITKI